MPNVQPLASHNCRFVAPKETAFKDVSAESAEDAANTFHLKQKGGIHLLGTDEWYAVVEVLGDSQFVSKIHLGGIGRAGGVKPTKKPWEARTLADVAKALNVSEDELAGDDWCGESDEWVYLHTLSDSAGR